MDQAHAQRFLQALQLHAEGGGRKVERLGGLAEMQVLGERHEIGQLAQFHLTSSRRGVAEVIAPMTTFARCVARSDHLLECDARGA
jgi:hypothetical protein